MQDNEMKEKQAEQEAAEAKAAEQEAAEAAKAEEAAEAEDAKNAEEAAEPEVDPKDAKIEELQNRLLRLQADFENFRRRTNIEKEQLSTFVTANVVGKFLKVLDNFERAEASVEKGDNVDAVVDGMKKIRRQFEDAFKDLNVEEIEAQNAKFDPNIHEAVMRGHNPELDDEIVDMVFEKGYKLGDKVIRHSKVRVNTNE
ncbi:nucleotide exchange factor GrpE [uncultured Phascolarctobacterium sp.]|uniref:nucleotide exchange factor GrpE n=1 Tax=uncultured Phascolarctobacterium sp. TaxID=512296 RepID=UPI0025CB8CAE|nr:nucleotide exchange factor GrpE [uncultured Phascolarctobacterium sp.]